MGSFLGRAAVTLELALDVPDWVEQLYDDWYFYETCIYGDGDQTDVLLRFHCPQLVHRLLFLSKKDY